MPKWLKISLKIFAGLVTLLLLALIGGTVYISYNKAKVLALVNTELKTNINGTIIIGDMEPEFFKGFPEISLRLKNVLIRDERFSQHHHTLLDANDFAVSLDARPRLGGTVKINHIAISNATVDIYTDSTGYSNTSVFGKGSKKKNSSSPGSSTELKKFSLTNVSFSVNDQKAKKLFSYVVNDIHGKMDYPDSGWMASFHLDVITKSMAFSTAHGSFIKGKDLEGDFTASENNGRITVNTDGLDIGDDNFKINAVFETAKSQPTFVFHIVNDHILWRNAAALLSKNITIKLNMFDIDQPIAVTALISGSFEGGQDPSLYVTAKVKNSTVTIPGAKLNNCSFDGIFTNNYQKGKGYSDDNSVIRFIGMNGVYNQLPFNIDTGSIINLNNPIATGNFRAAFPVRNLNGILGTKVARFDDGNAAINLRYKADIVNYRLNKPLVAGSINLKNADFSYIPANLTLKNSSLSLNFVGNNLVINNVRLQSGRSVVNMNGRVNNFLNLYYNAPEKIVLTWNIRSQELYLGEFLGFLNDGGDTQATPKSGNSGNAIDQLSNMLQKGSAELHIQADNAHYFKFLATDVHADIVTSPGGIAIKSVGLKNAGGSLRINGYITRGKAIKLALNTTVSKVNVHDFFYDFDNFGLKDFTYQNLEGLLSARTNITAGMTTKGTLIPGSINGTVDINLQQAALINFKPLLGVGKFAFPFRNLKNITIPNLDGHFKINGDKIEIAPMKISSSVLNIDVAGTYGLTNGTNIAMDIPLRNPKGDTTDKKRYKGIVLHILAKADETGKIKIGFNKERKNKNKDKQQDKPSDETPALNPTQK